MIKVKTKVNINAIIPMLKHHLKSRALTVRLLLLFLFLYVSAFLVKKYISESIDLNYFLSSFIFFALFIGVPFIAIPRLYFNIAIKQNKTNKILSEQTYSEYNFDTTNFTIETTKDDELFSHSKYCYPLIYKVDETPSHLFIYVFSIQAFIIPKSAFDNKDDLEKVIALLKQVSKYKVYKR
ncbi:MAG: YcxB family protein [Clostridia bacterium]|nr:YcxB family protein [Clostridia bacterium]